MPLLRPLPFSKIALVGLNDDREVILSNLHDLGVVQVEPVGAETLEFLEPERASEMQRQVGDQLVRFRGLAAALPKTPAGRPIAFRNLADLLAAAQAIPIDEEVGGLKREEDQLLTERRSLEDTLDLLRRFSFYAGRYEDLRAKNGLALFGEGKSEAVEKWRSATPALRGIPVDPVPAGEGLVRFLVAVPISDVDSVTRLAGPHGVTLVAPPKLAGTGAEETPRLNARLQEVDARLGEIRDRLAAIAGEWYPRVAALEEGFEIENRQLEVHSRLGASKQLFALEGWVPKRDLSRVSATVRAAVSARAEIWEVPTTEEPPTYMENPAGVRRYEFFVRFYSLPKSTEWDPTLIFAIAFPIFFGLMLGDWGYGLVILGFSLWMIAGFPGRKRVPNAIKGFLKMIMAPEGMRSLAYALVPGCLVAISLGLVFNSFFGAHVLPYNAPVDPLRNTSKLLLLAGYMGVAMVVLGFGLGALKAYFHHHYRHILGKVGGILATIGIATFGLGVIRGTWGIFPEASNGLPLAVFFGGFLLLLVGDGVQEGGMAVLE
ncbi:MAG TPA: V-type ATPase 116kDa subunit family protein, partial [Thermoplasmata archaeon]|nr:V-type ATPase 116kDa subunit family protein [Thermoplasmata archaeon]